MSALESSQDVAAAQLQSNILHLRSQLHLAAAVVQAKDATISAQQTEIASLREHLDLTQYLPSTLEQEDEDREPLIEGFVSMKRLEVKGFELPAIARMLKRYIGSR
jgi:hypothetical protein